MKKFILVLLTACITLPSLAQKDDLAVKIKSPKMDELINKLWVDLPARDCTPPASAIIDKGEASCAGIAMKHLRLMVNQCKMTDAFTDAIKMEFKLLKLIPAGKVVGTILDVADLSAKALSAKSPEDLEADLVKYGFGKVAGDDMVGKLKKLAKVPDGEEGDVLANLTKLFYKQLWDKAKGAIFPKAEKYECHPTSKDCKDNILFTVEPYTGNEPNILGKLIFSADGDCNCQLACAEGQAGEYLKDWSIHGEMLLVVDKAEIVDDGLVFKSKVLQVTLRAEKPSYHVQANCDCTHSSNMNYERYPNTFFAGLGLVNEDAGSRFNTYGGNFAYTHLLSSLIGVTGDAGAYFGSDNNTNYTKLQVLAGISLAASQPSAAVSFTPHVLAGVANVHAKYKTGNYSSTSSSTALAAAIGVDIMKKIKGNTAAGIRLDYNPVFGKGGVKQNFRLALGASFGGKHL